MKKILWYLTFFGFLGMWRLNVKFQPEKTGVYQIYIDIPLGMGATSIIKLISKVKNYSFDEYQGISMLEITKRALFFETYPLTQNDDPISVFRSMKIDWKSRFNIITDGAHVEKISKICEKVGCKMGTHDITPLIMRFAGEKQQGKAHDEVLRMCQEEITAKEINCPSCGETASSDSDGDCFECSFELVKGIFDYDRMLDMAMQGKKPKILYQPKAKRA